LGLVSWIVKKKTKDVIRGVLQAIRELFLEWLDKLLHIEKKEPDTYTESEQVEKQMKKRKKYRRRKQKDPTKSMRGF